MLVGVSNPLSAQQESLYDVQAYESELIAQGNGGGAGSASAAGTGCGFWSTAGIIGGVIAIAVGIVVTNGKTTDNEH